MIRARHQFKLDLLIFASIISIAECSNTLDKDKTESDILKDVVRYLADEG
jgi:hypothetical protein